jgi:hypothetical protein
MFKTFFLLVGIDTHSQAPDLPTVPGAADDCLAIEAYLTQTAKVPNDQVLAFCRGDAVRARMFTALSPLALRMHTGDRLVVVWIGQGTLIGSERQPAFIMADTRFESTIDPVTDSSGLINTTVTPALLEGWFQNYLPAGTLRVYLLDAMHGGSYRGLDLQGPVAHDFIEFPGTLVISASDSRPSIPGQLRRSFIGCWGVQSDTNKPDGLVTGSELQSCLATHLAVAGGTPSSVGDWAQQPILATGSPTTSAPIARRESDRSHYTINAVRWTGFGLGVAALGVSAVTYSQALTLYDTFDDPSANYQDEASANEALREYHGLTAAAYGLLVLGGVGLTAGGLTFVVGPTSLNMTGSF